MSPIKNALNGPVVNQTNPQESFGELLFNILKNHENPKKNILIDGESGEKISYETLFKLSIILAENLKIIGVAKGDTISIISENNWKLVLVVISGFYIGAKIFLLNHDYTTDELEHLLSKCPPKLIICSDKTLSNILKLKTKKFCCGADIFNFGQRIVQDVESFDKLLIESENSGDFRPTTELNPERDVALILNSSGTTGLPKAVLLTHKGIKTIYLYARDPEFLNLNQNESSLAYLPMFHILGIGFILGSILRGTTSIILKQFAPEIFLKTIQEYKITKLVSVPPILLFLAKSPLVDNFDLSSIRDIIGGGALISKDLEEMVKNRFKSVSVRQIYGLTEVSGAISMVPTSSCNNKVGSCGKPVHNVVVKIRDSESGRTVKPLETGEICVKTDGIMKGYGGNIEETNAGFDEDNFFKTGDLGYCDEEGFVFIVDRIKDIMKYKGFQVAPAELEGILSKHPAVKEVAVVGKPDERAGELPIAFVVVQSGVENVTEDELVGFVAERVSVQKRLHGGVRFVNEIPKSSSGKILRRQLRELLL